jgi:guanylate kinase
MVKNIKASQNFDRVQCGRIKKLKIRSLRISISETVREMNSKEDLGIDFFFIKDLSIYL